MEIHQLTLAVSEADLTILAQKHLGEKHALDKVACVIVPEGLQFTGEISLFMPVSFETFWELGIIEGFLAARLKKLRALGLPFNTFQSVFLKMVRDLGKKEEWIEYREDTILVNVESLAAKEGVQFKGNFRTIECQNGFLTLTASADAGPQTSASWTIEQQK
jgi:hypothetical protein